MKIVLFYHSLLSDWNHGNAHFLRGIATELVSLGHEVIVYEPEDSWSYQNLIQSMGQAPITQFGNAYPSLKNVAIRYKHFEPAMLNGADLVIVHEWNLPETVQAIGNARKSGAPFQLFFHDTHHRAVTAPHEISRYDLSGYDGVLAYGNVLRDLYLKNKWCRRVWTWHEAADTRLFHPLPDTEKTGDLIWIGNWGDDERKAELHEFLINPIRRLGIKARVYGVRYPDDALQALREAGIEYRGWTPNFDVPRLFASHRLTIHVPRGPYTKALPGIPTIRPFEALACGIPLISAPWNDCEGLFEAGSDFLVAKNGCEMEEHIQSVLRSSDLFDTLSRHGVATIEARHSCKHRVAELLSIYFATKTGNRI